MELWGCEVLYERLESILPTSTSLLTVSDLGEVHIQIIDEYEDIALGIHLIVVRELCNRLSREIHIGCRLEKYDPFSMNRPFTHNSLEPRLTPQGKIPYITKLVHHDIPDIVSSILILFSRIAESDDEFHIVSEYIEKSEKVQQKISPDREIFWF